MILTNHSYSIEEFGVLISKIKKGNVIKISPNGKRQFAAADDEGISYVCIQVKENSLTSYTENDAIIY